MGANPKPNNLILIADAQGPVIDIDSNRVGGGIVYNAFKMEAGMVGVLGKLVIGSLSLLLHRLW